MGPKNSVAEARYARATLPTVSLLATGLVSCGLHSAVAPWTASPLLYAGATLILCGILTGTLAAHVHERATEISNGCQTEAVHPQS